MVDRCGVVSTIPHIVAAHAIRADSLNWQLLVSGMVIVDGQADLLEIITATHPTRRFPSGLYCGKEQADQHANDRDNHQQFDQGESGTFTFHRTNPNKRDYERQRP